MSLALAIAVGLAGAALVAILARRERATLRAARHGLLDACRPLFDEAVLSHGADGFPGIDGIVAGRRIRLALIPDSLTFRRLPQLWLSVTMQDALAVPAGLAALARPNGAEFYSLTSAFHHRLEAPPGFPLEILIRGADAGADKALAAAAPAMAALLADARVKEVAVTARGARVIYQAAEGQRGEHLLLRQAVFADGMVEPGCLIALLDGLDALCRALAPTGANRSGRVEKPANPAFRIGGA